MFKKVVLSALALLILVTGFGSSASAGTYSTSYTLVSGYVGLERQGVRALSFKNGTHLNNSIYTIPFEGRRLVLDLQGKYNGTWSNSMAEGFGKPGASVVYEIQAYRNTSFGVTMWDTVKTLTVYPSSSATFWHERFPAYYVTMSHAHFPNNTYRVKATVRSSAWVINKTFTTERFRVY